MTLLYITWTPVAEDEIFGLAGRHFIPISILPFLCFYNTKKYIILNDFLKFLIYLFIFMSLLVTVSEIIYRYYIELISPTLLFFSLKIFIILCLCRWFFSGNTSQRFLETNRLHISEYLSKMK
jgi:uncharacterized membrane protein